MHVSIRWYRGDGRYDRAEKITLPVLQTRIQPYIQSEQQFFARDDALVYIYRLHDGTIARVYRA